MRHYYCHESVTKQDECCFKYCSCFMFLIIIDAGTVSIRCGCCSFVYINYVIVTSEEVLKIGYVKSVVLFHRGQYYYCKLFPINFDDA